MRPAAASHAGAPVALAAQVDLGRGQVADLAEHVVQLVGAARPAPVGEALQLELDVGEHARVEQLAQLLGAEQVAQQVAVERQRRGAALGQRRVALVHVGGDPVEQQALRERRRLGGVDADHPDRPAAQLAEHLAQRRQVEHVLQALARRLQQDRERRVLGATASRSAARWRCCHSGVRRSGRRRGSSSARPAHSRNRAENSDVCGSASTDQLVDLVGVDDQLVERQLVGGLGQAQHDAVVAPHRLDRHVVAIDQPTLDGHRPRRVHRACRTG